MAPRSMRRGSVRAILAGGLLAAGSFAVLPANAAPPTLGTTSVESGWSPFNAGVAADFDEPLDVTSTATMRAVAANTPVAGTTTIINNGILFEPSATLAEDGTVYEITFSPVSAVDLAPGANVVRQFRVDTLEPGVPTIRTPSALIATEQILPGLRDGLAEQIGVGPEIAIAALGEGGTFEGVARDPRDSLNRTRATSGISEVHIRFYSISSPREVTDARVVIDMNCSVQCGWEVNPWTAATDHLTAGYWTARAVAFDLAGNASAPSSPISFLKLG